ncbi:MAG TPA: DUF3347 domain-containing protein [Puia sp.]|nr:DUF3347 domain-containing protein [Puia sp.]
MRKWVILIIIFAMAGLLAYRLLSKKEDKPVEVKDQALRISKNSGPFNNAFAALMTDYYTMKDALVEWDTLKADQAAYTLGQKADSLPIKELKADSNIIMTAQSMAASIGGEAKGFTGETTIEAKRRAFNALTDQLYTLINAVRYDGETIYHIRCPMAFKDSEEGFWLSNTSKVINPYLGKKHPVYKEKMLGCGELIDSLNFAKK